MFLLYIHMCVYTCVCVSSYSTTVDYSTFSSSRGGWLRWYREQFLGAHCHRIPPRPAYEMAHLTGETSHQLLGRSCIVLMIWQCLQRGIPSGKRANITMDDDIPNMRKHKK